MFIPIRFACCFQHATESVKSDIADLIEPIAPELWPVARDKMLLPVLHRMADFDARLPRQWISAATLPPCPPPPTGNTERIKALIQIRFWMLCRMARRPEPRVFDTFFSVADSIMTLVVKIEDSCTAASAGLWTQISLVANVDPVLQTVSNVANSSKVRDRTAVVDRLEECGALEYALMLAEHMTGKRQHVVDAFVRQLECALERQAAMRTVLAAAMTDTKSTLYPLGSDLLQIVVAHTHEPRLILWEDILRDRIEHDISVNV